MPNLNARVKYIASKLNGQAQWNTMSFEFSTWKSSGAQDVSMRFERLIVIFDFQYRREVPCVLVGSKVTEVQEALEARWAPSCGAAEGENLSGNADVPQCHECCNPSWNEKTCSIKGA